MFGIFRLALRSFAVGVVVGVLVAPRPGVETRRMLSERISRALSAIFDMAALPPVQPERARTNGHAVRPAAKKTRASTDARSSS